MNWIKSIHKNEMAIAILYGLIALALFWFTCDFNFLIGFIGLFIAVMMYITAKQQNQIQKDNIKLQMFDKRYAVYEAIADSLDISMRKDYSNFILSGKIDPFVLNKLINDANSNLSKQTLLSQTLFKRGIYEKIRSISDEFNKIAKLHFKSFKENLKQSESDSKLLTGFGELFSKTTFATTADEIAKCNIELEANFPDIYKTITEFNAAVDIYAEFVKKTGILTDFNQYLIIHNLDK